MYARPAFLSHNDRERIIQESIFKLCDHIRLTGIDRSHADASDREKNNVQCQSVIEKAGVLTDELSNAITKVVAGQNDRANEIAKKRIESDMLFACRFVESAVDKFNPYVSRLPVGDRSKKGTDEKPFELRYRDVPENRIIIEYPKNSKEFYILDCPICEKSFDMLKDLYYHITNAHSGIITGAKFYTHALEIGGTRVKDAERSWVKEHNEMCKIQKNILYAKCKKRFMLLHKDDNKDKATPARGTDSSGETSTMGESTGDGHFNDAAGASATSTQTEEVNDTEQDGATQESNGEQSKDGEANENDTGNNHEADGESIAAEGADAAGAAGPEDETNSPNEEKNDEVDTEMTT